MYRSMTVSELKLVCKRFSLKKYSKLKKDALIEFIVSNLDAYTPADIPAQHPVDEDTSDVTVEMVSKMTVAKMKALCKSRNIKGYSKYKSRCDLMQFVQSQL